MTLKSGEVDKSFPYLLLRVERIFGASTGRNCCHRSHQEPHQPLNVRRVTKLRMGAETIGAVTVGCETTERAKSSFLPLSALIHPSFVILLITEKETCDPYRHRSVIDVVDIILCVQPKEQAQESVGEGLVDLDFTSVYRPIRCSTH